VPALICLIFGAFRKELLIVGAVLLAIDLFITLYFTIKTVRLKGSHEMFNLIVNAANDEKSSDDSYEPYSKPDKDDLYSEKTHELRSAASSAKSVREVFEMYKKTLQIWLLKMRHISCTSRRKSISSMTRCIMCLASTV
jgi:hypothetical protein